MHALIDRFLAGTDQMIVARSEIVRAILSSVYCRAPKRGTSSGMISMDLGRALNHRLMPSARDRCTDAGVA